MISVINSRTESSRLKEKGNEAFKAADFNGAKLLYAEALQAIQSRKRTEVTDEEIDLKATLLCNMGACDLKLKDYQACVDNCSLALELKPIMTKALYRKAFALDLLDQPLLAMKELSKLIHYEPNNSEAIALMRKVKLAASKEHAEVNSSEVKSVLESVRKDSSKLLPALKALIGLCFEERSHAMDLGRKQGVSWLAYVINEQIATTPSSSNNENSDVSNIFRFSKENEVADSGEIILAAVRVLSAASNHKSFVESYVEVSGKDYAKPVSPSLRVRVQQGSEKLSLISLCDLLYFASFSRDYSLLQSSTILVMTILKHTPLYYPAEDNSKEDNNNKNPVNGDQFVSKESIKAILAGLLAGLKVASPSCYSLISESISALLSQHEDYFEADKAVDMRLESTAERKARIRRQEALEYRAKNHIQWAIDSGLLDTLIEHIDHDNSSIRHHASLCLGKLVNSYDIEKDSQMKSYLSPYLPGRSDGAFPGEEEEKRVVELKEADGLLDEQPAIPICRRRAALEATLLVAKPELGAWALRQPGGLKQLLMLVSTGDHRCQGIAAEVMCLAASNDSVSTLLAPIVSSGVLNTLLHSPSAATQAAAASTTTKLAIKAKAMTADSAEVAQVMNTVLSVLKSANKTVPKPDLSATPSDSNEKDKQQLVSFSSMDTVSLDRSKMESPAKKDEKGTAAHLAEKEKETASASDAVVMTSVERAIEVLAAMVGKTHIKEEIVHGSYR